MYDEIELYNLFLMSKSLDNTNRIIAKGILLQFNPIQVEQYKSAVILNILSAIFNKDSSFEYNGKSYDFDSDTRTMVLRCFDSSFYKDQSFTYIGAMTPNISFYHNELNLKEKVSWFQFNMPTIISNFESAFDANRISVIYYIKSYFEDDFLFIEDLEDIKIPFIFFKWKDGILPDSIFYQLFDPDNFEDYNPTKYNPDKLIQYVKSKDYIYKCALLSDTFDYFLNLVIGTTFNY